MRTSVSKTAESTRCIDMRVSPIFFLPLTACIERESIEQVEPTFIQVSIEGELGTEEAPLDFTAEARTMQLMVSTLSEDRALHPFEGDLKIRVRPGRLQQDAWVTLTDGQWSGEVSFEASFGPTRVWFSDEGDKQSSSERVPSYGTGVSEPIHIRFPTIAQMQQIDDHETNQLDGEFAELRIEDREVVITKVGTNGFWVTDLLDGPAAYGSLYVYSFSKPEGISEGDRLVQLTGNNQEYLATTQLSFPTYVSAEGESLEVPDAVDFDVGSNCDGWSISSDSAEALEASLVEVRGLQIPDDFCADPDCSEDDYFDYIEYGQWPLESAEGCKIYVSSSTTIPDFDPLAFPGASVTLARGMLAEIWGKWILVARDSNDLSVDGFDAETPEFPALPTLPSPRPRTLEGRRK
jgi:hypothetical protein